MAAVVLLFAGVSAHRGWLPNALASSGVSLRSSHPFKQLEENLALLVSPHRLQILDRAAFVGSDLREFASHVGGLEGDGALACRAEYLSAPAEDPLFTGHLVPARIATLEDGAFLVVTGRYRIGDDMYYQVSGGANCVPQLIRKELLESRVLRWATLFVVTSRAVAGDRMQLVADQAFENFGVIAPSEIRLARFRVRNVCRESLEILPPVVSCSCVRARFERSTPVILAPGEEVVLDADVTIGAENLRQAIVLSSRAIGSEVVTDTLRLDLIGSQLQVLQYSPKELDFGEMLPDAVGKKRKVIFKEVSSDRFRIASVDCGDLPLRCTITEFSQTGSSMSSYELSFCYTPMESGRAPEFSGEVIVVTTSPRMPKIRIPVKGR